LKRLLGLEPFSLCAQSINVGMHPRKKQFSRGRRNSGSPQLENLLSLAGHLHPHSFTPKTATDYGLKRFDKCPA
jgi:hypothetical protein